MELRTSTKTISVLMRGVAFVCVILLLSSFLKQPRPFWVTDDQMADQLMSAGDYSSAADAYSDPVRQGVAHFRDGNFEVAASDFARVDNAESSYNRGVALVMLGQYDDAIESFDRALQFRPDWLEAKENRALAVARRDQLNQGTDDAGGTGGKLAADKIVFDDRAKNATQTQEVNLGEGNAMSDAELQSIWLKQVQTEPGDFLRAKFSYQLWRQQNPEESPLEEQE